MSVLTPNETAHAWHARKYSVMTSAGSMRAGSVVVQPSSIYSGSSKVLHAVNGPLGQTVDPAVPVGPDCRPLTKSRALARPHSRLPSAMANHPLRPRGPALLAAAIVSTVRGAGFHLNDEGNLARQRFGLHLISCISSRSKSLHRAQQQRCRHKAGCHRQGALKVVFTLGSAECCNPRRKANSRQYPKLPKVTPQKGSSRPNASRRYAPQLFFVHCLSIGKGIEIDWGVATSQGANQWACSLMVLEASSLVQLSGQIEPRSRKMSIRRCVKSGSEGTLFSTKARLKEIALPRKVSMASKSFLPSTEGQGNLNDIGCWRHQETHRNAGIDYSILSLMRLRCLPSVPVRVGTET